MCSGQQGSPSPRPRPIPLQESAGREVEALRSRGALAPHVLHYRQVTDAARRTGGSSRGSQGAPGVPRRSQGRLLRWGGEQPVGPRMLGAKPQGLRGFQLAMPSRGDPVPALHPWGGLGCGLCSRVQGCHFEESVPREEGTCTFLSSSGTCLFRGETPTLPLTGAPTSLPAVLTSLLHTALGSR